MTEELSRPSWTARFAYWSAVFVLALPLALITLTSLSDGILVGFPIQGFSLRWHLAAVTNPDNLQAFALSASLAGASAALAVIIGYWIALAARGLGPVLRVALFAATIVPLATPGVIHAIALRVFVQTIGLAPGFPAMLFGHVVHATPLAAIMIAARLSTTPVSLIEAARDLGASQVRAFLTIELPWIAPALASAALLAGLTSFDDFLRSFFLGGYEATLPVLIYGRLRSGLTPEINALSTLVLIASIMLGSGGMMISRYAKKNARR